MMKMDCPNLQAIIKADQMSISPMEINKITQHNNITVPEVTMSLTLEIPLIHIQTEIKPDITATTKTSQEIQEITQATTLLEIPHTIGIAIQVDGDFDSL